ncbi:hypothetical protein B0T20DRAFT_396230 [Sordaria brevicollis]|uniref:Uncharacterized protein n=1 Tax=Sordaria brevicollis TaxID=83679 RepID=A0AAE0U6A4_SORBR|nr:hypothetical protein B0T20DRAFT_396230 [Sordaria brevicollis]
MTPFPVSLQLSGALMPFSLFPKSKLQSFRPDFQELHQKFGGRSPKIPKLWLDFSPSRQHRISILYGVLASSFLRPRCFLAPKSLLQRLCVHFGGSSYLLASRSNSAISSIGFQASATAGLCRGRYPFSGLALAPLLALLALWAAVGRTPGWILLEQEKGSGSFGVCRGLTCLLRSVLRQVRCAACSTCWCRNHRVILARPSLDGVDGVASPQDGEKSPWKVVRGVGDGIDDTLVLRYGPVYARGSSWAGRHANTLNLESGPICGLEG